MEDVSPSRSLSAEPPRRWSRVRGLLVGVSALALLLAAVTGVLIFRPDAQPAAVAEAAPPPRAATPFEQALDSLKQQAAALLAGDEKGWLAAVDPDNAKLRKRYRDIYRNLRGLDVTHLEYHAAKLTGDDPRPGEVLARAKLAYCFSMTVCPTWRSSATAGPPRLEQDLTLVRAGERWVITKVVDPKDAHLRPTPWENTALTVIRGKRVTVAGPKSQTRNLKRVLKLGDKAAATADRFAKYMENPQQRYRIYVADKKTWNAWYGGFGADWAAGYAIALNKAGTDVILNAADLGTDKQLATLVKHELGHAVTLSGADIRGFDGDKWLTEGIAEYIGAFPDKARQTYNRYPVRAAYRSGKPPRTIVSRTIDGNSSDRTVNTFYAMGHFAADCLATRYSEQKLFDFVRMSLREDKTHDQASRAAFGKPFATVDKACVKWIKDQTR